MKKIILTLTAVLLLTTAAFVFMSTAAANEVVVEPVRTPEDITPYLRGVDAEVISDTWDCNAYASSPGYVPGAGAKSFSFTADPEGWEQPAQCTFQLDTTSIPERVRYFWGWGNPGLQVLRFKAETFDPVNGWFLDANYNPSDNDIWNRVTTDNYIENNYICLRYNFTNSAVVDAMAEQCDQWFQATTTQSYDLDEDDILSFRVWGNSTLETIEVEITELQFWYVDYMLDAYSTPFVADWLCHPNAAASVDEDGTFVITSTRSTTQRVGCVLDLDESIFHSGFLNEVSNSEAEEGYFGITFEARAAYENFDLQSYSNGPSTNLMWTDTSIDIDTTFRTYCLYWDDPDPELAEWSNASCDFILKNNTVIGDSATYMPFSIPNGFGFNTPVLTIRDMRLWSRWSPTSFGYATESVSVSPTIAECTDNITNTVTSASYLRIDGEIDQGIYHREGCIVSFAGLDNINPYIRYWVEDDSDVGLAYWRAYFTHTDKDLWTSVDHDQAGALTAEDYIFTGSLLTTIKTNCGINPTDSLGYDPLDWIDIIWGENFCQVIEEDLDTTNPRHYPYNEMTFGFSSADGFPVNFIAQFSNFYFELLYSNPVKEWTAAWW